MTDSGQAVTATNDSVAGYTRDDEEHAAQGSVVMQMRALGPGSSGEAILGGISTRQLVQVTLK